MMVSVWWAVAMLLMGAYAGMIVFALMSMAARECEQGIKDEKAVARDGFGPVDLEKEWTASILFKIASAADNRRPERGVTLERTTHFRD